MSSHELKKIKEQIVLLTKKIDEDLMIKSIKPGEIVLTDPSNDEVPILQKADNEERIKILAKIEDDIKDDSDLNEKRSYSAKASAAGHDIGEKGKNFKKIADKAGHKYGSKKAGEKVAGAILAKLRNESSNPQKALMIEGMAMALSGLINEKLKPSMGVGAYIDDFVHSNDSRFNGKSKEDRIKMAKGAYYGSTQESTIATNLDESSAVDPKVDLAAGYRFYVIDKQTKQVVGKYKTGASASSAVDKKDNEYGAYRYFRKKIESMLSESAMDIEHLTITPELLLRSMEWAKESAGEDIQLHKYIEALSDIMANKDVVDSDDYETIINKVTPNNPAIDDNGPENNES